MTELPIDENTPRILIVEDEPKLGQLLIDYLRAASYAPTLISHGDQVLPYVRQTPPDLILLDIMLPDEDGVSILKKLKSRADTENIPVIMMTAKSSEYDKVLGLDSGADDYITKPFGVMELISRVKAVLRRSDSAGDDTVITNGSIELNVEKHVVSYDGNNIELTYKEFELLRVLMKNAGNVMTREILMDRVWGTSYEGESRTLDMHIKTLRKKLGEDGGKLIKTVRNVGYKFQS